MITKRGWTRFKRDIKLGAKKAVPSLMGHVAETADNAAKRKDKFVADAMAEVVRRRDARNARR